MAGGRLTIKDVARIAGVGVGTVSRVLNDHKSVDPSVRAHVREAIRTLNYEPDAQARDLRRGATSTVGMIVRDRTMKHLVDFVRAAQEVLQDGGYSMTMAFSDTKERELDLLERGRQKRLAGILMTTSGEDDDDLIAARDRFGAPIVFLESEVPGDWQMVNIAHDMATRDAIDHLVNLGHRRIALVASDTRSAATRSRISGFRAALDRHGLKCAPSLIRNGARGADAGFADCLDLMRLRQKPTAILAGGLDVLSGILRACRENGLRIPNDLSVIGSGDSELAELMMPGITVMAWDWREMGRLAARELLAGIAGNGHSRRISLVPTSLTIRASCGTAP